MLRRDAFQLLRRAKVSLPLFAGLLLLIAFLAADFWLTIGVVGALYILTVPVTCFIFLKVKSRYLKNVGGALDAVSPVFLSTSSPD